MTWTKLPDEFNEFCQRIRLSDAAFRTHVEGLVWCMRRETGGELDDVDIRHGMGVEDPSTAIAELVAVGWWETTPSGYRVLHDMEHQPELDVIAARRVDGAQRQAAHRRKVAGLSNAVSHGVSNGVTSRVTRDGTGRDGAGRVRTTTHLGEDDLRQNQAAENGRLTAGQEANAAAWLPSPGASSDGAL